MKARKKSKISITSAIPTETAKKLGLLFYTQ